jgi:hypothetical protein
VKVVLEEAFGYGRYGGLLAGFAFCWCESAGSCSCEVSLHQRHGLAMRELKKAFEGLLTLVDDAEDVRGFLVGFVDTIELCHEMVVDGEVLRFMQEVADVGFVLDDAAGGLSAEGCLLQNDGFCFSVPSLGHRDQAFKDVHLGGTLHER